MPVKRISKDLAAYEQEYQDALEAQENEDCNKTHSPTGMCPCCGVEVEVHEGMGGIEQQQICPSCGWQSGYLYDL